MGSVYLAEHPSIGKKVALKVLHSEFSTNQEVAARFFHEAKAVNDIGHPNIVDIVDFGIIQTGPSREQLVYFIMEYLAGVTLSQLIRVEAPLAPERALSIALQVADALSASHKCGIVHRDLKPDNIILMQRGRERDFVKLLDFGIAKLTGGSAAGSHRTRTGIVMGTPAYMSPEQCEGRDTVDLRTDVYALGIVIYEMLTGRVPFVGDGYGEILVQHLTRAPVPPSQYRMLPAHVEVVVLKALEKRADMRYPMMEEFMRAMSDPVGYVEAHGGVAGFLQRQLRPSNAPLPAIRMTPAPLTPLPGTLIAPNLPSGIGSGTPSMPGIPSVVASVATPSPTTLGSAAGQVQGGRKAGYILAGLVIVAVAVALIIVLVGKDRVEAAGGGSEVASDDRGSATASGSTGPTTGTGAIGTTSGGTTSTTGTGTTGTPATGSGTTNAAGTTPATGSGATNATGTTGTPATGSGATNATGTTGTTTGSSATGTATTGTGSSATGTAATGSDASAGSDSGHTVREPTIRDEPPAITEIGVSSTPSGARIYVDGVDTGKITPDKLEIPRKRSKPISITLKLKGYDTYTFRSVEVGANTQQKAELVKAKADLPPPVKCRTPERSGCRRDAKGCCVPESSTGNHTGSGNKTGSAAEDPDGLIKP